jgi:hypothetical protein
MRCEADYAVFIFNHVDSEGTQIICIIAWHVDDGLAGTNNCKFLDQTKSKIKDRFGITDLGPVTKYLGVQFVHCQKMRQLWMHQEDYIVYVLQEHSMSQCNPVSLPMDSNFPFGCPTDVHLHVNDLDTDYQKLVGKLLYLAMYTQPDIAHTVMRLAQNNSSPELCHYMAAKHVLRYLAGTINLRTHYGVQESIPLFTVSAILTGPCAQKIEFLCQGTSGSSMVGRSPIQPRNKQHMLSHQPRLSTWRSQVPCRMVCGSNHSSAA